MAEGGQSRRVRRRRSRRSRGAESLAGRALPKELLDRASSRLRVVSFSAAVLFLAVIVLVNAAPPPTLTSLAIPNAAAAASVVISLGVFFLTRMKVQPENLIDIGLFYEVFTGFAIALAETFSTYDPEAVVSGISWLCLWITIYPLIVPSTPGKTILAGLVTATMSPLAILVAIASGAPPPPLQSFLLMAAPNFGAVVLAVIFARMIYQLSSDVSRARELGAYRLEEMLGAGGMGEVWAASHRMLARPAAIKLVHQDALVGSASADSQTALKRFEREAQVTARLTSPHTIELYDYGVTDDGTLYYVMELLHGVDLEVLVNEHGPVSPGRAIHFLVQACESLAEAHEHELVHRDMKPANIYVCKQGTRFDCVKVLDFGLVAEHGTRSKGATRLTADGVITGTPAFMAPEIITGEHVQGEGVDIYGLGCVAYWLLTGQHVFDGATAVQIAFAHVERKPEPPSARAETSIPDELDRVILQCLAKDPRDRPGSAGELAERLAAIDVEAWTQAAAKKWWKANPIRSGSIPSVAGRRRNDTVIPASKRSTRPRRRA